MLSGDYMNVPLEDIAGLSSLLTLVGGRVMHADGPFAKLSQSR